MCMLHLHIGVN